MALPILSAAPAAPSGALVEIRKTLRGKPAANDPEVSRETPAPPAVEKISKSKVVDIKQVRQRMEQQRKEQQKIEKVPSNNSETARQSAHAANEKAIERSQSQSNPLIPLLSSMNGTLSSMNGTLKSILGVLRTQTELLSKILSKVDIGDSNDDTGGGIGLRKKTRREKARDRLRERRQRQRDRDHPPGRVRKAARTSLRTGKKGLLGLAGLFGLSQLLPEPAQDVIDVADTGVDVAEIARGAPKPVPGTPPGVQGNRLSGVLGTGGKVISKLAVPLAIGMSLYENKDELLETGAIDPIKQAKKMGSGFMNIINPQDTEDDVGGLHIMKRLGGVGDVLSGATGAILGGITTGGKAIYNGLTGRDASNPVSEAFNSIVPSDITDSIVDGIVGLLGGETNADREKKAKEVQAKVEKEIEEKKKIRLEAEKKAAEDKAKQEVEKKAAEDKAKQEVEKKAAEDKAKQEVEKKAAEDKAKQEVEKKTVAPTAPSVPPVVVDTTGKPVPVLAPRRGERNCGQNTES
jgi:hypothetical protein